MGDDNENQAPPVKQTLLDEWKSSWYCYWDGSFDLPRDKNKDFVFHPPLATGGNSPLISIVIPTYKRRQRLEETVRPVQQQSFANWELIVSDDEKPAGSTWQ